MIDRDKIADIIHAETMTIMGRGYIAPGDFIEALANLFDTSDEFTTPISALNAAISGYERFYGLGLIEALKAAKDDLRTINVLAGYAGMSDSDPGEPSKPFDRDAWIAKAKGD